MLSGMLMVVSFVQCENASEPIALTLSGKVICVNFEQ